MIDINELRRLAQAATPGPDGVSLNWLKLLQDFQKEANPAVINELLDRLEAAEKERDALRQELDIERGRLAACGVAALGYFTDCAQEYRSASLEDVLILRAKIEALERQEPVGEIVAFGESLHEVSWNRGKLPPLGAKLYALPGAKGEDK